MRCTSLDDVGSKTCAAFVEAFLDTPPVSTFQQLDDGKNFETVPKSSFGDVVDTLDIEGWDGPLGIPRDLHRSRPQSSSASRFTAGASEFFILSQSGERPEPQELLAVTAVLPVVTRMVISVVVSRGVVTPVVGVDVGITEWRPLEIGAPIGITEKSLWHPFVDARNISFCRLSRHGQNCSRHHRENAEHGVAGLAHSPLRSIQSSPCVAQGLPDRTSHTRFEGSLSVLVGRHGAMNPAGRVRCNRGNQIRLANHNCNFYRLKARDLLPSTRS